jgi:hypothetical protein
MATSTACNRAGIQVHLQPGIEPQSSSSPIENNIMRTGVVNVCFLARQAIDFSGNGRWESSRARKAQTCKLICMFTLVDTG